MLAFVVASVGILLVSLILLRALQARTFAKYPYFCAYAISVLIGSLVLWPVRAANPLSYLRYYWPLQFVTLVFGYGIILEIFSHVLSPYPGVERFARFLGLAILAGVFAFALIYPLVAPASSPVETNVGFERSLRSVQAILLFGILAVISHYQIPIGWNMKGMILGYGLYVGSSLVSLAVEAYAGAWLVAVWRFAQPISFAMSLLIWLVTMWSYAPNPAPEPDIHLEEDYEAVALRTRALLGAIRSYLFKAVRS